MEVKRDFPDFLDRSITHGVLGYDFSALSARFGLSFTLPFVYRSSASRPSGSHKLARPYLSVKKALSQDSERVVIGWLTAFAKREMSYSMTSFWDNHQTEEG